MITLYCLLVYNCSRRATSCFISLKKSKGTIILVCCLILKRPLFVMNFSENTMLRDEDLDLINKGVHYPTFDDVAHGLLQVKKQPGEFGYFAEKCSPSSTLYYE